ncbi:hypothetical protein JCM5350_003936 [Sporobolomyces pararoseus]
MKDWRAQQAIVVVHHLSSLHSLSIHQLETFTRSAGRKNRVEVNGSSFEALRIWKMAKLEEVNRLVLRAYHSKSFDEYIVVKAAEEVNPRLSKLDLDRLDSENLKLVKIDLPEEDWFQFTLE